MTRDAPPPADARFCAPVGAWIDLPVTVTYLREHKSRYGHGTCLHRLEDDAGRTLTFWDKAPLAEVGDHGRVRGQVTRHLVEFGRAETQLGQATFRPGDPYALTDGPDDIGAALDAALGASQAAPASATPTPPRPKRRRAERPRLDLDEAPDERPAPRSLAARFSHLDFDDPEEG